MCPSAGHRIPWAATDRGSVAHAVVLLRRPGPYAMTPRSKAIRAVAQVVRAVQAPVRAVVRAEARVVGAAQAVVRVVQVVQAEAASVFIIMSASCAAAM